MTGTEGFGDLRCDVCIIGGGLIGTSAAWHLARAGVRVVLLERGELASEASGASFGWAAIHFATYMPAYPAFHMRFMREGLQAFRAGAEPIAQAIEFRASGGMSLLYSPSDLDVQGRSVETLSAEGIEVHLLTREEVVDREPALTGPFVGAVWSPREALASAPLLVGHFARAASGLGAHIHTDTPAESVLTDGGRVSGVATAKGRVQCETVVIAAGIHAPQIAETAGVRIPVRPDRGQQILLERTERLLGPAVYGHVPVAQLASGRVLLGGVRENVGFNPRVTIEGLGFICREAAGLVRGINGLNVERVFAGLRPVPLDGLPILGPAGRPRGLIVAVMHFGFTLSFYAGRLIAELVTSGKTPEPMRPYTLERFEGA